MQKRMLGALVGIALLMTLCMNVLAAYTFDTFPESQKESLVGVPAINTTEASLEEGTSASVLLHAACDAIFPITVGAAIESRQSSTGPKLTINGVSIADKTAIVMVENTTYVSIRTIAEALYPEAKVTWQNGQLTASGSGFNLTAKPGDIYLVVNDRYLYVPDGILFQNGTTLAPIRTVCTALGASIQWDVITRDVTVATGDAPLSSGSSYYNAEDLRWMASIITAESRNQPLEGKIAVGSVIMNRVESTKFPNTIHGVIFEVNQFTPVQNGSIYSQPTPESVIAAKLVLDGAREAEGSLFFNQAGLNCWAARNRDHVATIADHSFYT